MLRGAETLTAEVWLFVWYLVSQLGFDTMFTIVLCAYVALMPQMTLEQQERRKIQILNSFFVIPGGLIGFVLPLLFLADPTPQSIGTFQLLVIVIAIFGVIPYFILSYVVREHSEHIPKQSMSLGKSLKLAFKNKSYILYLIYDGISVYIINVSMATIPFFLTWVLSPMLNNNLAMLLFWIPPILCIFIGAIIEIKLAEKFSIKTALSFTLGVLSVGYLLTFALNFTGIWFLVCIGFSLILLGFPGDFILHNPMRADTIDYDFWKISGERREGLYAGIGPLLSKPMISVALATPTSLMTLFGLVYIGGKLQPTKGIFNAFLGVNIAMGLIPGLVALGGFVIWVLAYPLTGEVVEQMKNELLKVHQKRRQEYLKEKDNSNSDNIRNKS
jgi:Na+/melibiose symporter-like transporter